jgi:thiol-disulfide isomerase/thioredoxin
MRRVAPLLAALAVAAIVVIGLLQASKDGNEKLPPFHLDQALRDLRGAPAPLAQLHAQHSQLLDGDVKTVRARLKALRGHPVVLNKWGSWCVPCRQEFPVLQQAGQRYGKRVAFLGVDVLDNAGNARSFLRRFPVTYPSYRDPHGAISQDLGIPANAPVMLFLDARGKTAFIHQGQYKKLSDFEADIKRYLLGAGR